MCLGTGRYRHRNLVEARDAQASAPSVDKSHTPDPQGRRIQPRRYQRRFQDCGNSRTDVVYSNVGSSLMGEFESIPEEEAWKMFDVNSWGAVSAA